jgi:hypothetical protein
VAKISVNCKEKYLGSFKTKEEALAVRVEAEKLHHSHYCVRI